MKTIIRIFVLLIILLFVLLITLIPMRLSGRTKEGSSVRPLVIAHRGAAGIAPENTMPAIDSALAAGADFIEIDVHLSRDNALIIMHDETVDRTTDGNGRISDHTSKEIASLDAGSWFGQAFTDTRVPVLEDVIKKINGQTKLLIEIKKKREQYVGIEEEVISLIRKYHAEEWCVVQSFNDEVLETFHEKAPDIRLHKLIFFKFRLLPFVFDGKITRFNLQKYSFIQSFNMNYLFFTKAFSKKIHDNGKMIFLWGCRKKEPCFPLNMEGFDGIITDFPDGYISRLNTK